MSMILENAVNIENSKSMKLVRYIVTIYIYAITNIIPNGL